MKKLSIRLNYRNVLIITSLIILLPFSLLTSALLHIYIPGIHIIISILLCTSTALFAMAVINIVCLEITHKDVYLLLE